MHQLRVLTLALIFSGALNIALIATLAFPLCSREEAPLAPRVCEEKELLGQLQKASFAELVAALTHRETRELALAILVAKADFDIARALPGVTLQSCPLFLPDGEEMAIYPKLQEEEYEAILHFAYLEKWPQTARGIFRRLKGDSKGARDASLMEALFVTSEFRALQLLFQQTGVTVERGELVDLISEGSWEQLSSHVAEGQEVSIERRDALLLHYLASGSSTARKLVERLSAKVVYQPLSVAIAAVQEKPVSPKQEERKWREHVVGEGETLWKICKKYRIKLEDLCQFNGLESDRLYPGMILRVPS
ncbi:MAG: LysM peptidoglycan-binding domain-containing protein [Verrucomicrobiota bacterium]|nr:LysM peptidoglycan-binding domain-containing protein [Verrucomicrobiota bacterium]